MVVADANQPCGVLSIALSEVFKTDSVELIPRGTGKSSVISLLVRLLINREQIKRGHAEQIIAELVAKERHATSALGKGLAFPHLRTDDVQHFVGAIGVAPDGLNFGAADGEPTRLIFLVLAPRDARQQQTELMSRLVAMMSDKAVRLRLQPRMQAKSVYDYLIERDKATAER